MFRPSSARKREYELLVTAVASGAKIRSCDKGKRSLDQTILNAVYWNRTAFLNRLRVNSTDAQRRADGERYVSLEHAVWRIRHVFNWPSRQCLQRPSDVLYGADSFHFFDRFAPWGHNCSATTVLAGDACHADVMTAELEHLDAGILCNGVAAAQKLWFSELFRLPTELSRECQARLERIRTQQPG